MKHGANWYHRDPLAYLGGVQGLTARQHAVYGVVIDLCYQHGGAIHNDPRWISGWIADMGSASVRTAISELIDKGKLFIDSDGNLSQKRAKSEAKTRENLRKTAEENGKKGGKKSAELRAAAKENKDIAQAVASSQTQADKIREDKISKEEGISYEIPKKRTSRKPELPLPDNWVPSERNLADAEAMGFSTQEIADEADRFRNRNCARGERYRDWDAAWRYWLGNARKFANGGMARGAQAGGRGPGGSLASIAAWRRATGAV